MNNATQIIAAFREMTANKSISRDELHDLIKDGIVAALAKRYGPNVEAEITIDEATGRIGIVVLKEVVQEVQDSSREISLEEARWDDPEFEVGDIQEVPVEFEQFGRNAVMAAKQRILQRVREGERQKIRDEYEDRVGELLSGEVQQVERGKLVVHAEPLARRGRHHPLEGAEPARAVPPGRDRSAPCSRRWRRRPRGRASSCRVRTRSSWRRSSSWRCPEIQQGIVEIRGVAREVGGRSKLAVSSRDESIDPVGACVGLKGSRVRAVVQELGGERIDIVPFHPDPEMFAKRALAPARVAKVISDYEKRVMTAIVDEDQLSLAIGRNGQNVRLASQLIGWQMDLYGSREWLERGADLALFGGGGSGEYDSSDFPLRELELTPATLAALEAAGYTTFFDVIDLEREDLLRIPAIGPAEADRLLGLIEELTVEDEEGEAAPAGEAEPAEVEGFTSPE